MEATLVSAPAKALLSELEHELHLTRRVLERAPEDQFGWQPHPKSRTLAQQAHHTVELLGWIQDTFATAELDLAHFTGPAPAPAASSAELLAFLAERGTAARAALSEATATDFGFLWTMRQGEHVIMQQTRAQVTRHLISHMIHHRAQLMVYLRLLNVPVPGIYGPSADEQ